jgi:hypothetical protein
MTIKNKFHNDIKIYHVTSTPHVKGYSRGDIIFMLVNSGKTYFLSML